MEEEKRPDEPSAPTPEPPAPAPSSSEPGASSQPGGETSSNMEPNLAALLAYVFGWISGLIFFLIETKNKYVRFHALQSILFSVALAVLWVVIGIVTSILGAIPGVGLMILIISPLLMAGVGIGGLVVWIMLMVKSYQGEKWKLPIIGDIAEKNA